MILRGEREVSPYPHVRRGSWTSGLTAWCQLFSVLSWDLLSGGSGHVLCVPPVCQLFLEVSVLVDHVSAMCCPLFESHT